MLVVGYLDEGLQQHQIAGECMQVAHMLTAQKLVRMMLSHTARRCSNKAILQLSGCLPSAVEQ